MSSYLKVKIGNTVIGGGEKIAIQSMTTTKTCDILRTVEQISLLEKAGCDIVRITVPDMESARAVDKIKNKIGIPLVADIHFDYRIALECIDRGIDKVRINPGNIGDRNNVKLVATAARKHGIPIRIGVNSGSVDKILLEKYGSVTADAMVESVINEVRLLESADFGDIVLSLKASDVRKTIDAYRKISTLVKYPLHIGITEAGNEYSGLVKSSVGLGSLLADNIGDTIRVSLTADPVKEIYAAKEILKSLSLIPSGVEIISCPTCGRCNYDLIHIVNVLREKTANINKNIKIAVMGCVVNGPGEAKDADFGVAGGLNECIFFRKGEYVKKIPFNNVIDFIVDEINKF